MCVVTEADVDMEAEGGGGEASVWHVEMEEGHDDLLHSVPSDNTISAVQVSQHCSKMAGVLVREWKCFTHVTALLGKNPTICVCGDPGKDFNAINMMNLCNKQWCLTNHHRAEMLGFWVACGFSEESFIRTQRGLMGKWESWGIGEVLCGDASVWLM